MTTGPPETRAFRIGAPAPTRGAPLYVEPTPGERLRLAVIVAAGGEERWLQDAIRLLQDGGIAEVVAIIRTGAATVADESTPRRVYRGVDRLLHGTPALLRSADLPTAAPAAQVLEIPPAGLLASEVERLTALKLDVILAPPGVEHQPALVGAARHGVWSCRFGANENVRREAAIYDDLMRGGAPHALIVGVWESSDDGERLRERSFALRPESIWPGAHLETAAGRATLAIVRAIRRLALGDLEPPPGAQSEGIPPLSAHRAMAGFVLRSAIGLARRKWTRARYEDRWLLAHRSDPRRFLTRSGTPDLHGFRRIEPPAGRFYADPNLFTRDGVDYLFFEDWDDRKGRASISVLTFDAGGTPGEPATALACDHHLSYPFLFEWEGEVFLLPEMSETRTLRLFRARRFPGEWEPFCDLMTGHEIADPTLHFHDGRWYLFATVREVGGNLKEDLFLFHADTPLGPFRPHPRNPIRTDIRCARPAGRLFLRGEVLLRPAQDCSTSYGAAIQLCEVQELSPGRYSERIVDRLEPPDPDLDGCHTLTFSQRTEVIDVKRRVRRRWAR